MQIHGTKKCKEIKALRVNDTRIQLYIARARGIVIVDLEYVETLCSDEDLLKHFPHSHAHRGWGQHIRNEEVNRQSGVRAP